MRVLIFWSSLSGASVRWVGFLLGEFEGGGGGDAWVFKGLAYM
jgi:hypothetical protein